ncbi:hypothetical protein DLJ46_25725 [Micromonospora globispora]|uniref:Uncharacterized protein n=1 Tax=Micromonospora globispora TaxID=1450148 RepID=A0A317JUJ8_9ACTN|nr:hypothetical protein [Micromonospora globispora]PWU44491.1 hypothetical protein DLJ46_25725 [Micromonospora globispora]
MNWRQFTVALVQALAWPSVALVVLLVYRRRIAQLLGDNLRRLKAGPIEAEWEQVAEEARATIETAEALPADDEPTDRVTAALNAARAWADSNGAEALQLGWTAVAWAIDEWAESEYETGGRRRRLAVANPAAAGVLARLRQLREIGMREGYELTPQHSQDFLDLVEDFIGLLRKQTKPSRDSGKDAA